MLSSTFFYEHAFYAFLKATKAPTKICIFGSGQIWVPKKIFFQNDVFCSEGYFDFFVGAFMAFKKAQCRLKKCDDDRKKNVAPV